MADLGWLRERRLDAAVTAHARSKPVLGICAGMQMLGTAIADPSGIEGNAVDAGLGLLPVTTELATEKVTVRVRGRLAASTLFGSTLESTDLCGYEIHVGRSEAPATRRFARLEREGAGDADDGCVSEDGNVVGTYVHGLFDGDALRWTLLDALRSRIGLKATQTRCAFAAEREARIDRLAAHVRTHLDVESVLRIAGYR